MRIRTLKADEIECRVGTCSDKGVSLLLYKNARVDMDILDETFGSLGWQRHHSRDNANCTVSVWDADKAQWIEKEDTGTESNTEAEKGLASDSFKRACVNLGIGRELYTSPFIWVKAGDCSITQGRNGKPQCYDKFSVVEISYDENRRITDLSVRNDKSGKIVFEFHSGKPKMKRVAHSEPKAEPPTATPEDVARMRARIKKMVFAMSNGKPEDMATALHVWTDGKFVRLEDIPAEHLTDVLGKAEKVYRKRGFTD